MTFHAVLAGCGSMARGWLKAVTSPELADQITIVGLVDIDLKAAEKLRGEFNLSAALTGTDLARVLASTKPDMVFDVVIPSARREVVATALQAGCHVLSEKPMAVSMDEAQELLGLARAAGKIHAIVQNRRYVAGVRRVRRFIESGAIGTLTGLHADFFIGAHFGGFRDEMQSPLLLDMSIHTFDAARFMSGKQPLAVYCYETNPAGSWYKHGGSANAVFEMSDGVVFTYRGSWCAEGAPTSWESAWRITGSTGTLLWDGADHFEAKAVAGDEGFHRQLTTLEVPPPADTETTHGHTSVLRAFVSAVRENQPPETASNDNIKSLGMVFGAIESAATRQRVEIKA
ncbi:MAG: Gfo/Idh/MocA family oxidoreductase [Devosia sp.]